MTADCATYSYKRSFIIRQLCTALAPHLLDSNVIGEGNLGNLKNLKMVTI